MAPISDRFYQSEDEIDAVEEPGSSSTEDNMVVDEIEVS